MSLTYAQRIANRLAGVPSKLRADAENIGQDADEELAALRPLAILPEQRAALRSFLDAAAGAGLVMGEIDAAELFGELFGGPAMAACKSDGCAWVGYLSQCRLDEGPWPSCPQCGEPVELE
jgi:hypothetical protein